MNSMVRNSMMTPDGTLLISRHRHDYVSHQDKITKDLYFLDGGLDYVRRSVNDVPAKDLCVFLEDGHDEVRGAVEWGTYGKEGNEPLRYILLKDMETDHIKAILDSSQRINEAYRKAFKNELTYRKKHGI